MKTFLIGLGLSLAFWAGVYAADEPAPASSPVVSVVFVFTDCAKPVAIQIIADDNWYIHLADNPRFLSLIAKAREGEAAGGNVNFIELRAPGTCSGAKLKTDKTTDI